MKKERLTKSDIETLIYFWQEKRDIERITSFEELKPLIIKQIPMLLRLWDDYKSSISIMDIFVESLNSNDYENK